MVSWADLLAFIAVALALVNVLLGIAMIYVMLGIIPTRNDIAALPNSSKKKGQKHK